METGSGFKSEVSRLALHTYMDVSNSTWCKLYQFGTDAKGQPVSHCIFLIHSGCSFLSHVSAASRTEHWGRPSCTWNKSNLFNIIFQNDNSVLLQGNFYIFSVLCCRQQPLILAPEMQTQAIALEKRQDQAVRNLKTSPLYFLSLCGPRIYDCQICWWCFQWWLNSGFSPLSLDHTVMKTKTQVAWGSWSSVCSNPTTAGRLFDGCA